MRRVHDGPLISQKDCLELIAVFKALSAIGYRPGVRSSTISDVAMIAPQLLVPLVKARQKVWSEVENLLDLECELHVEFTGLISWTKGSSLGWHTDDNRSYLSQRHFSSVLYLNSCQTNGHDHFGGTTCQSDSFSGGRLMFKDEQGISSIEPQAGKLVAFPSSLEHMVEEVYQGERFTLTMWFTRSAAHREDDKILRLLQSYTPRCLPSAMYSDGSSRDIRIGRLQQMGYQVKQATLWKANKYSCTEELLSEQNIGLPICTDKPTESVSTAQSICLSCHKLAGQCNLQSSAAGDFSGQDRPLQHTSDSIEQSILSLSAKVLPGVIVGGCCEIAQDTSLEVVYLAKTVPLHDSKKRKEIERTPGPKHPLIQTSSSERNPKHQKILSPFETIPLLDTTERAGTSQHQCTHSPSLYPNQEEKPAAFITYASAVYKDDFVANVDDVCWDCEDKAMGGPIKDDFIDADRPVLVKLHQQMLCSYPPLKSSSNQKEYPPDPPYSCSRHKDYPNWLRQGSEYSESRVNEGGKICLINCCTEGQGFWFPNLGTANLVLNLGNLLCVIEGNSELLLSSRAVSTDSTHRSHVKIVSSQQTSCPSCHLLSQVECFMSQQAKALERMMRASLSAGILLPEE